MSELIDVYKVMPESKPFVAGWSESVKLHIARHARATALSNLPCENALRYLQKSTDVIYDIKAAWLKSVLLHLGNPKTEITAEEKLANLDLSDNALITEALKPEITQDLLLVTLHLLPQRTDDKSQNKPSYSAIHRRLLIKTLAFLGIEPTFLYNAERGTAQQLFEQLVEAQKAAAESKDEDAQRVAASTSGAVLAAAKKSKTWRIAATGAGVALGGLAIGLTGGLAAPAVGGLLAGATGGFLGFLTGTTGVVLIGGLFGVTGATLAGHRVKARVEGIEQFEFEKITADSEKPQVPSLNCSILSSCLYLEETGYKDVFMQALAEDKDAAVKDAFVIKTEVASFMQMTKNLDNYTWNLLKGKATSEVIKRTALQSVFAAVALPAGVYKTTTGIFDSEWIRCLEKAKKAGYLLATVLLDKVQGDRPVILTGTSLGAVVIFYALLELAKSDNKSAGNLVYSANLISLPIHPSERTWNIARSVVAGDLQNTWSSNDWVLALTARLSIHQDMSIEAPAGLGQVEARGVSNVDCSDIMSGHLQLCKADVVKQIIERTGC